MSAPKKIRYHLNIRAVLILAALSLITALGLYALWGYQQKRMLDTALEQVIKPLLEPADKADDQDQKSRNNDLALRHLAQYLDARPDDPEGLDIEAKLLLEARNGLGAAKVYEHLIRVEGLESLAARGKAPADRESAPVTSSSRVQTARRLLAEIYIQISDFHRNSLIAKLMPETAAQSYHYQAAELHAKNLLGLDETAPSQPFSKDAHAHLLYALALEGQIVPGQSSRDRVAFVAVQGENEKENEGWEVGVEDGAILEYENALALNALALRDMQALEPMDEKDRKDRDEHLRDDLVAAMRLAGLYQKASRKTTDISKKLQGLIDAYKPIETDPGANRPDGAGPKPKNSTVDNETKFVRFLKAHSAARRLADLYQGSRKDRFDLRLMSSVSAVSDIPTAGNNLVIIAKVGDALHFRIFEGDGRNVVNTDETRLTAQAGPIADLKKQLENLWPPHRLGEGEKDQVIAAATSIVGRTRKNIDVAKEVLDRLRDVHDSVDVRTVRYAFFNSIGEPQNATAELEQAILLDPENLVLILTATENAMRSASAGTIEPQFWLDQVPLSSRDDPRFLMVQGLVQYNEQKYEAALATWRKGLKANPSALGFSQRLALVLLELGRDEEAAKIIDQYGRLVASKPDVVGKSDPVLEFLKSIQAERAGRFSRAIESLESVRSRLPESFQTQVHLILARCQEKQGDLIAAAQTYRTALRLDPKSLPLRLHLGQLLLATQPEEAAREFEQGLKLKPNHPAFLVCLAEARLLQQKALPQGRRNWSDFDAVRNRANAVMPSSIVLALLKAERLAADNRVNDAIKDLRDAVKKNPESPELAARLADYLRGQGRAGAEEALEVLTKASAPSAAGDRGLLRVQRAMALTSLGDQGREARDVLLRDVNKLAPADRDEVWTYLVLLCKSQGNPETTRAIYNDWGRLLPDDPRPKFALLDLDIEANDQNAIADRLKTLATHKDQGGFMYRLVQAWQQLMEAKKLPAEKDRKDLLKEADKKVEEVLHEFKLDTVALLLKGQILEEEGSTEEAADFYSQGWARGNVTALVRLVDLWARLGREPELDRLRQNDKTRQLDQVVAKVYLRHGARREAAKVARQSLAENPGRPSWQVGVLDYLGKNEEAEASLRTLAEQQPDKLEPWLALVRFRATQHRAPAATDSDRRHKVEEILEEIERLLKGRISPDELLAAECRFAAADWPAADKAFDAARKRYPDDLKVQEAAKRYEAQKGHLDKAEERLSDLKAEGNIVRFTPLLKAGWPDELLAAECRFAAADWTAADKAFNEARKRYPQLPQVQAAEAALYRTQKGRPDAAEACLRRLEAEAAIAAEIEPRLKNQWPDELLAAECRFAAADWPAADKAFDAARKRYPGASEVQEAAKRYQAQKGRPDAAEACLRRLKIEATIAEAKQRVKLPWPELIEAECRRAVADWPAADQAFDDAAAKRYRDVRDVQLAAARYYEERARLDDAEACLRRMLSHNPDDRGAALELAIVLSNRGDQKQALELLDHEGPNTNTNTPEERLARAIVLGRSRDVPRMKQAIDMLQALLADIPAESSLASTSREVLTRFLLASGQADQASRVAGVASARGRTPTLIALYAEALLQTRQFDAAEEQRKQLEQLDPENPRLANLRAQLILGRSKPAEAAAALEKAYLDLAKESGSHAEQFGREAFLMIQGLGPNAQGTAEDLATRLAKQNPAFSWMTASILANRGKHAEALVLCRTAVEAGKSLADFQSACRIALEVVVASRSETTTLNHADEILETALKRMPAADDLMVVKAMINHFQSRFDEELRLYRSVLSRQPQFPLALNNIAWVLSEGLHQPAEALEKIDKVIQLTGRDPNNVDTRGVILVRLGRLEQAIDELKRVVQAEPTGVHYFHLAQAYKKAGRDADFHKAFEEAKRAGLTAAALDPTERADFEAMLTSSETK